MLRLLLPLEGDDFELRFSQLLKSDKTTHLRGCIRWLSLALVLAFPAPVPSLSLAAPVPFPFVSLSPVAPGLAPSPVPSLHWQQLRQRGGLGDLRTKTTDITHTHRIYTRTTLRDSAGRISLPLEI